MRPLHGIRVLDLSRLLPGPMCTLILADLGATVDKLEDPGPGDYLRHMPAPLSINGGMDADASGPFHALNRDKRSIVLDLKHREGAKLLLRLLRHYDVVVESFRPGVLARLGLSFEQMHAENPRLVICSITGYGQSGPDALRAGHDLNYLARAGVLGVSGPENQPPAVPGAQSADVAGGSLWATVGILSALFARNTTGKGTVVDTSMTEGSMMLAAFSLGIMLADGKGPARGGHHLNGGICAYHTYATKDGKCVALGALEPKFWLSFCAAVGLEPSLEALVPGEHQLEWKQKIATIFAGKTRDEWVEFSRTTDCCVEPVLAPEELPTDPQHKARGMFFELAGATFFRTPLGDANAQHTLAREAGADTNEILVEHGLTPDEIAFYRQNNVIR